MARGPRPTLEIERKGVWITVVEHEKAILTDAKLQARYPCIPPFKPFITTLCQQVYDSEERRRHLAGLVLAAICDPNRGRTTADVIAQLIGFDDDADHLIEPRTVLNFANGAAASGPFAMYLYARALMLLIDADHECARHHLFQAVLAGDRNLVEFRRIFQTADLAVQEGEKRLRSIASGGKQLYDLIQGAGGLVLGEDLVELAGPDGALRGVEFATLQGENVLSCVCIRSGSRPGDLIVAQMDVVGVRSDLKPGPGEGGPPWKPGEKPYFYNQLFMRGGDQAPSSSAGYFVARKEAFYVLNQEAGNLGFIFMAFSKREMVNLRRDAVYRGVVMGLNRGGDYHPMISRMVLLTDVPSSLTFGQVRLGDVEAALRQDGLDDVADAIRRHLYDLPEAEVETTRDGVPHYFDDVVLAFDELSDLGGPLSLVLRVPLVAPEHGS